MLLSSDAVADVEGSVESRHFYRAAHGALFDVIVSISRTRKADPILALEHLAEEHCRALGGLDGLLDMQMQTPAMSNASGYAEIVKQYAERRDLLWICGEMAAKLYEGPCDAGALLDHYREEFLTLEAAPGGLRAVPLYDSLSKALTTVEEAHHGRRPRRAATGFPDLDDTYLRGGFAPGSLYVLGARPAMGKSALAAELALNVARSTGPVLLVTLEMSDEDIALRLMASRGRIDSDRLLKEAKSTEEWNKITNVIDQLMDTRLFLMSDSRATVTDVRRTARQVRSREGDLSLIVVDYMQLMGGLTRRPETRQLEIAEISRSLKVMAGEMDCAVLAVSQLNRGLETRNDKRPVLSDLRESGTIEQDGDVVMFLYRDEVYNPDKVDNSGRAELHVAKNRNGPTGRVNLLFLSRFTAFKQEKKARAF